MFTNRCRCINCITPPHILNKLLENPDKQDSRRSVANAADDLTLARRASCEGPPYARHSGLDAWPAYGLRLRQHHLCFVGND